MSLAMKIIKGFENYWGDYQTYTRQLGPVLTLKETSRLIRVFSELLEGMYFEAGLGDL